MSDSWHRVDRADDLGEGRVRTAVVDGRSIALTRCGGTLGALDNRCPHQGGPLGEGSIENGWLRCPWHGYDYHPRTGTPPEGFSDAPAAFEVQHRDDGVYVRLPDRVTRPRSVSDVLVETLVAWGVDTVFGMVGHSNLPFAEALRRAEERGQLRYIGIRHEGAAAFAASAYGKLTGRPAGRLLRHRRPGLDEPDHWALRRQAGRLTRHRDLRPAPCGPASPPFRTGESPFGPASPPFRTVSAGPPSPTGGR